MFKFVSRFGMFQSCASRFIILFQGRTGSTFLVNALQKHPEVRVRGEFLAPIDAYPRRDAKTQNQALECFFEKPSLGKKIVGFKTKLMDVADKQAMKAFIEQHRIKTIVMTRKNQVKLAISRITSARIHERTKERYGSKAWNLYDEKDRLPPQVIPVKEFQRVLDDVVKDIRRLDRFVSTLNVPKLHLEYTDLLKDKQVWFKSVFDFLEIRSMELDSNVRKNTNDDLRQCIVNFDELSQSVRDTPFESMFNEVA